MSKADLGFGGLVESVAAEPDGRQLVLSSPQHFPILFYVVVVQIPLGDGSRVVLPARVPSTGTVGSKSELTLI